MGPPSGRRRFDERDSGESAAPREIDAAARAQRLRILAWTVGPGGIIGFLIGAYAGGSLLWAAVGAGVAAGGAALFATLLTEASGRAASTLYNPSGISTPREREYSRAQSLAVRGRHEEALAAYEAHIEESPEEPEPYLRVARILRDELGRYEDAARWFRRARRSARLSEGQEMLVSREIVEIYRDRLDDPRRAAPELARMADRFAGRPEGEWARTELEEVRRLVRDEAGRG